MNNQEILINGKSIMVENEAFSFNFHLFKKGGGLLESERLDIPLLAEIPYSEDLMLSIDKGEPLVQSNSKHSISKIFIKIAQSLVKQYE
jgi:ATP-binding protein involved in chromosome partitioning